MDLNDLIAREREREHAPHDQCFFHGRQRGDWFSQPLVCLPTGRRQRKARCRLRQAKRIERGLE